MINTALVRYNLRVVMFNNWWILVFPIAASQLTVFWNIVTQKFRPALPAMSAEMITPLLAAFLGAHVLTAEYPSRVGAILASKPLHIGKLVLFRLIAVLGLVWALELISLEAYAFGMAPYNVGVTFLASVPSTLFLALLAITFATLLRHPMAGFGVAALYWALDLPGGTPINPYLSLRSYSNALGSIEPASYSFIAYWWIAKVLLLAGTIALYAFHARMVFGLGVPLTQRGRRRALGWAASLLVVYLVTGACAKVLYGYGHLGSLEPSDAAWFRRQFSAFGPVPVAYLFGPAFHRYLGDVPSAWRLHQEGEADILGDTLKHQRELREVVERMPRSIWAPSAADLLGRLVGRRQTTTEARVAVFQHILDTYPHSPYADHAVREKALAYDLVNRRDEARGAYEELLKRNPTTIYRTEALRYIMENDRDHNNLAGAEKWAREWLRFAPLQERFAAYMAIGDILRARGDMANAKAAAKDSLQAVKEFRKALLEQNLPGTTGQQMKWDREAREVETKARGF